MNRFLWLLLNLGLVTAVCGVSLLLTEDDPEARWEQARKDALASAEVKVAKLAATPRNERPESVKRDSVDSRTMDTLWRRSLFRPDRTEDIEIKAEKEKVAATPPQEEWLFELKAIFIMNERRVAIIQVDPAKRVPVRPVRGVRLPRRPIPTPPKKKATKAKRPKRLFREGEVVGETGYTVVAIRKAEVTLRKGDEEKILAIERRDAGSLARRAAAAKVAPKPAVVVAAVPGGKKPTTRPTHMPPPPPGGPGGPGSPVAATAVKLPTTNAALAERRKRVAEDQKKRLEKYRRPAPTN